MDQTNSYFKCPKIINRNIELRPNNLFTETNINIDPGNFYKCEILLVNSNYRANLNKFKAKKKKAL